MVLLVHQMLLKSKVVVYFAWFTIAQAVFHLSFELYAHVLVGQTFPSLVADLLAVGLPTLGAIGLLKLGWGPGALCGGWGFEFCLYYRSWVWRVDEYLKGDVPAFVMESIEFLSPLLAIAAIAFVVATYICIRHEREQDLGLKTVLPWIISILSAVLAGVIIRLAYKLGMQLPAGDVGPISVFLVAAVPVFLLCLRSLLPSKVAN